MLVLKRMRQESIVIGHAQDIKVTVIDIIGPRVSIGIEAPMDIPVHRAEVVEKDEFKSGPKIAKAITADWLVSHLDCYDTGEGDKPSGVYTSQEMPFYLKQRSNNSDSAWNVFIEVYALGYVSTRIQLLRLLTSLHCNIPLIAWQDT